MSGKPDYESPAIPYPRRVIAITGGFVIFAALVMTGLYFFYVPVAHEGPLHVTTFSEPRLQIDTVKELDNLETAQRREITVTRWLDRKAGVLAIPIDAAVKAVAARGQAAFDPLPNAPKSAQSRPAGAVAPTDRRPNPGKGAPDPTQEGQ